MSTADSLAVWYERLSEFFGPQRWWPAESPFEVLVGAVLTQNTNWQNVERAVDRLRQAGLLSLSGLRELSETQLASLIRPSGYYNVKARRLLNLVRMIDEMYGGRLELLFAQDTETARQALLAVKGIGEETADSILLYAGNHPIFVVDAYTYRICVRHNVVDEECDYRSLQELFMNNLQPDVSLFNEFHALLVMTGKHFCKKAQPRCEQCPLYGL